MKDVVRAEVLGLHAYEEEPGTGLNLAANTNLFGANPALSQALARLRVEHLSEYPTLASHPLRQALAMRHQVDPDMVVTGNGSNDLIDILCRTFIEPGERVAYHLPTFSMIPLFARLNHANGLGVPLDEEWNLDVDGLVAAEAKVTFIVRPNNPTGNAFPRRDVERVLEEAEGIVVLDEAYVEFLSGESFIREVREGHERLVVLRTFSKAYGMAGLRVGYAVTHPRLAREMNKVRGPYRLNVLGETAAGLAIADDRYLEEGVQAVRVERPNLKRALEARGFTVFRSDANFVLTRPPVSARLLSRSLAASGIHVRDFVGDLAPYLRITVGPASATARLSEALDEILPALREAAP